MARKFKKRFLKRYLNMIDASAHCVGHVMAQLCDAYHIHLDDILYHAIRDILIAKNNECLKEQELNRLLIGDTGTDDLIGILDNISWHAGESPPIRTSYVPKQ